MLTPTVLLLTVNHLPPTHENLSTEPDDPRNMIIVLKERGKKLWAVGDKDGAIKANTEALDLAIMLGDKPETADMLSATGKMQISNGDPSAASTLQKSTEIFRELGDDARLAASLGLLGRALLRAEDIEGGVQAINESMKIALELKDHRQIAYGLALMAEAAVARKDYHHAALLWSASEANYDGYDKTLDQYDRRAADLQQDRVRRVLGEMEFERIWAKGMQLLPLEAIAATSAASVTADAESQATRGQWNEAELTTEEVQVLGLLVGRLSTAEIAERLAVSVDTVNKYIDEIYVKLNVKSRLAARRYAQDKGIV